MAEGHDAAADEGRADEPAGPFLGEYTPTGAFRHSGARKASVLFYRNGGHSVATVSGVEHHNRRALARPHTVCEIALGTFQSQLQMELPAAGGTSFFKAEVDIHWSVENPFLAATEVVTDVAARLTAPVLERLREVSSQYRVSDAERADRAITGQCAGGRWDDLGAELGLRVRLYVRLRVDDRTISHSEDIRDAHASAALTQVHQTAFRAMLQGGRLEQLSYMLAKEPEEAKEFLEKIRQEGRQDEKERVDRLFDLVAGGQIQSSDVERQALELLDQGRQQVRGPIGPSPARRRAPELTAGPGPHAPETFTPDWVADEPPSRGDRRAARTSDRGSNSLVDQGSSEPEPPRRRRLSNEDDGWPWAEED
ncbi:hypothetical protein [Streptomyces zhihengii]|uniref:PE-PGRS family protein n=1 Tax=Streptomyces zhihengii TaxID=1818004 RepID=A0ABS2UST4_9ACTN|nr:hypothetical protein [Streptomyces zhihengii]MBM9620632.1 hypothetical protein [Streptomyces zhihengii]